MLSAHVERVILIGPSGSGKSTLAPHLAAALGWRWVDTDDEIMRRTGMSPPEVFATAGEARFREAEGVALAATLRRRAVVIATGAGIVERATNRAHMRARGFVVALDVSAAIAWARIAGAAEARGVAVGAMRPMLHGPDPEARVRALQRQRQAWYAEADLRVAADAPPAMVAARILAELVARGLLAQR